MGLVFADITIKNTKDVLDVRHGMMHESEIRQTAVKALVDTGAGTLIITEAIQQQLGLEIIERDWALLADKTRRTCKYTEPVDIHWKNRSATLQPMVLSGADEVLLGAIPLQDMDLIVDPARHELIGAHGDERVCRV